MLVHLPILQVIVPLMAAPLCLFLNRPHLAWLFALIASGLAFLISSILLQQVMTSGTVIYALGGWDAPWGIEYRIDLLNAFLLLIVSGISTVVPPNAAFRHSFGGCGGGARTGCAGKGTMCDIFAREVGSAQGLTS